MRAPFGSAALAALLSCGSAQAGTITFAGTFADGTDGSGLFGPVGADLTGDTFTIAFDFAPDLPASPGSPVPLNSVTITVNGSPTLLPLNPGYYNATGVVAQYGLLGYVYQNKNYIYAGIQNAGPNVTHTGIIAVQIEGANGYYHGGLFTSSDPVAGDSGGFIQANDTVADLTVTGATSTIAPPAPEPDAWALMLTGFGLAGAAMRRRRAVHA